VVHVYQGGERISFFDLPQPLEQEEKRMRRQKHYCFSVFIKTESLIYARTIARAMTVSYPSI